MSFSPMKGIIALDIDGTVTAQTYGIEPEVVDALTKLNSQGWGFIFITGRPFQWGYRTLENLPFSYALAVQNGALLLEMPTKKILNRQYLSKEILPIMEKIAQEHQTDFIIYTGFENEDRCYYRPNQLPKNILSYVLQRSSSLKEQWEAVPSYLDLSLPLFSSIKFFTEEKLAFHLSHEIEKLTGLHAPPNRDPFNPNYFVIQATHQEATKGAVLNTFLRLRKHAGPIIAAGDDFNDYSMLKIAHIKIVMSNAPLELQKIADIIAPPANQKGIIQGLAQAVACLSSENAHV